MNGIVKSFALLVVQAKNDMMLLTMLVSPLLIGTVFRYVVPIIESALCQHFEVPAILSPYYLLFDLLLILMPPLMFSFCGVMVMLEEIDSGISSYMMVSPLGKSGYLLSRIGLPTLIAVFYATAIIALFSLTEISLPMILILSFLSGIMGIITSLLVLSLASNKVEGMAMAKLSGLLMIGLPIPFFTSEVIQYLAALLPSLWFTKFAMTQNYIFVIPTLVLSVLLIILLYRIFEKKLVK